MFENCCLEDAISQFHEKSIDEELKMLNNKKVYIYGAGSFGTEMYDLFLKKGINVESFLDIKASNIVHKSGIGVFHPQDKQLDKDENTIVVFSIVMDKDIRNGVINFIKNCGFKYVIEAQRLRSFLVEFRKQATIPNIHSYLESYIDMIRKTAEIWEDKKSKEIYINNIYAHLTRDYSRCYFMEDNMDKQYFPDDIVLKKGYSTFIDCGGYIGDTVMKLNNRTDVDCIISLEPNKDNFENLSRACGEIDKRIFLYPCAVSNDMGFKRFSGYGGSGTIDIGGDDLVQTITLDKVLKNIAPTFVKMDIEGEEFAALKGAKQILKKYEPDLAICVYHYISDLWEIPILIKNLNSNYKLYLRSYNAYTMETVLYATVT